MHRVTLHGTQLIENVAVRRAQSWAVTQERVTVNISKRHHSSLKDKVETENSMGPAGWIFTLLPAETQTDTLRNNLAIF